MLWILGLTFLPVSIIVVGMSIVVIIYRVFLKLKLVISHLGFCSN
jgi:hypothetical protein